MRWVLVVCEDCGTHYPGFADEETILTQGGPDCHNCGGASLREVTTVEKVDKRTDDRPA